MNDVLIYHEKDHVNRIDNICYLLKNNNIKFDICDGEYSDDSKKIKVSRILLLIISNYSDYQYISKIIKYALSCGVIIFPCVESDAYIPDSVQILLSNIHCCNFSNKSNDDIIIEIKSLLNLNLHKHLNKKIIVVLIIFLSFIVLSFGLIFYKKYTSPNLYISNEETINNYSNNMGSMVCQNDGIVYYIYHGDDGFSIKKIKKSAFKSSFDEGDTIYTGLANELIVIDNNLYFLNENDNLQSLNLNTYKSSIEISEKITHLYPCGDWIIYCSNDDYSLHAFNTKNKYIYNFDGVYCCNSYLVYNGLLIFNDYNDYELKEYYYGNVDHFFTSEETQKYHFGPFIINDKYFLTSFPIANEIDQLNIGETDENGMGDVDLINDNTRSYRVISHNGIIYYFNNNDLTLYATDYIEDKTFELGTADIYDFNIIDDNLIVYLDDFSIEIIDLTLSRGN